MQIIKLTEYTILPFSEYIYKNKTEYITKLKEAQTKGNIDDWNFYFIGMLLKSKKIHQQIINKSVRILRKYSYIKKNENQWKVFLKFFKHIKLKKDKTINKLMFEGMSQAKAYRNFEEVSSKIQANKNGDYFIFDEMWEIYKGND